MTALLAIFSDVHGNLLALERMLHRLSRLGQVDGYICLGDTVGYGPWAGECLDLIGSLSNPVVLAGNHESDFLAGAYSGQNTLAGQFFDFCHPRFDRWDAIADLPTEYRVGSFTMRHTIADLRIFPDTAITLDRNWFIGHTHHQYQIAQPPYILYNTGSVGQNRGSIDVANFATMDTASERVELHAVSYDPDVLIREMRRCGYPQECIDYYATKPRRG